MLLAHIACDRATKTELPDFGIMIYGGGFVDSKDPTKLKEGFSVPKDAPPMFLACAHDDGQNPLAAAVLYLEYKKNKIPCELHLFTKGGHGFGMRDNKQPINDWPERCAEWMEAMHFSLSEQQFDREIEQVEKKLRSKFDQMGLLASEMKDKELGEIALQIQDARRLGQMAAVARLQKRQAELRGPIEQQMKDDAPMRAEITAELHRLKKEKLELEARRAIFFMQRSSGQP